MHRPDKKHIYRNFITYLCAAVRHPRVSAHPLGGTALVWKSANCCFHRRRLRASGYSGVEDESKSSPIVKRAKPTYLAVDRENQIIGYVVPVFRGRWVD